MIPSRLLVLMMIAPLLLGMVAVVDASLVWPMMATDGAIIVAAGVDALLSRRGLVEVERSVGSGVFSVGRSNVVDVRLRSLSRRALRVEQRDDLFADSEASGLPVSVDIPPRGRAEARYKVTPQRRGAYELGDHWVRYRSMLGLWIRQQRIPAQDAVRVYPDVQAVRAYEMMARQQRSLEMVRATRLKGGQSEFEALREYTRDDEYRSIDWKATANKGKLIARQYQLERNQSVVFGLDCGRLMTANVGGLPLFDHALNAALMLAHVAQKTGDHVGMFTFSADVHSFVAPTSGPAMSRRLVQATFAVHPRLEESNYQTSFLRVAKQIRKRSLIIIMTSVIDDAAAAELLRTTRSLGPRHLPLCVLFRDPELEAAARPDSGRAGELYTAAAASELLSWRDRLLRDLGKAGALVLDVEPGALTPALVAKYLDVKVRHLL